jgi:regulatory protein
MGPEKRAKEGRERRDDSVADDVAGKSAAVSAMGPLAESGNALMKRPNQPQAKLDLDGLMSFAGQSLARRAQSLSELRRRLEQRAARQEDVAEALSRLKEAGFLNDRKFADSFANWRRENQGLGKARVMRDLMARRVAPTVAKQAVDAVYSSSDETDLIEKFLERKYRGKELGLLLGEEKYLASAYRKLRTAGFSSGNSIRALKRYAAEAERLEEMEENPGE